MFQWPDPVSWYLDRGGALPADWSVHAEIWPPVKAIVEHPKYWKTPTTGLAAFLLLEGCRDLTYKKGGGFFTAMLKSEFHVIRHALEAYANAEVIQGTSEACGLMIEEGRSIGLMVRVNGADKYLIDRWDYGEESRNKATLWGGLVC